MMDSMGKSGVSVAWDKQQRILGNQSQDLSYPVGDYSSKFDIMGKESNRSKN